MKSLSLSSSLRRNELTYSKVTRNKFGFKVGKKLDGTLARTGVISTPHGEIKTPAFIAVGTKATLKALVPEQLNALGAQAVLANAYHLYLQPGADLVEAAGGLGKFMNWNKPTFTDSGGFQVMSLGAGFKKVVDMEGGQLEKPLTKKERLAWVDDEGATFKSHLDGSMHRFTPEISMQVQHKIGADIIFAFDELTTLHDSYSYQVEALGRTLAWAKRCIAEHKKLMKKQPEKAYQALLGVVQGANYEDLRRKAAKDLSKLDFDGFGIGGAIEKAKLGEILRWVNEELPESKPRHLLGISEPDDIFIAIEQGIDTFDCVSPARVARNASLYTPTGRINIRGANYKKDFTPIDENCDCYTCQHYTKAYLQHLFRAKEILAATLATIHNERFIVKLVDDIRKSIENQTFEEFKKGWLERYYHS